MFLAGIGFWGGFNWSLEVTNTESFCISCHEMQSTVYQEYRQSPHYANGSGVRATCPDCHVPREWVHMVVRKVGATNELYHKLRGSIDSQKKFEAKRWELAKTVWRTMEETDSRECRNCHAFNFMQISEQSERARARHAQAQASGQTCIQCHRGIAHRLPEAFVAQEHRRFETQNVDCRDCHEDMAHAPSGDDWSDEE